MPTKTRPVIRRNSACIVLGREGDVLCEEVQGALAGTICAGFGTIWCDLVGYHFSEGYAPCFSEKLGEIEKCKGKLVSDKDPPNVELSWNVVEMEECNENWLATRTLQP